MHPGERRPPTSSMNTPPVRPPTKSTTSNTANKGKSKMHPSTIPSPPSNQMNEQKVKRSKATWDDESTRIFCEVCADEVHAGNRPNTHFNRVGWDNVVKKFQLRTGKRYDKKQLKNKWEKLKSEFSTWKNLHKETGLGWNHDNNTIDASEDWWENKEQVDANAAIFREGGIKNLTEQEIMFSKIYASDATSWNPYSEEEVVEETEVEVEDDSIVGNFDVEDEEQVDITLDSNTTQTHPLQPESENIRKSNVTIPTGVKVKNVCKGKKSKVSTAKLMQNELKRIVGAMESFSQSSATVTSRRTDLPGCSIQECLTLLGVTPGVEVGSELYMLGTRLFMKKECREMFVALPGEDIRSAWLDQELLREKEKNKT
ncbi:L10-interacting MYB domain-containing protein-like [Spinacia oleracea]|uniref:L10-interacting MYB domain-containing protein-like n=1 Tax=Spinacia oleracea TaxID=3562 RepID=A0ABM3QRQ0_SPIOL|nr:L10-interacting MYB domain-containing protein-like [Spinacia oleracea]